MFLFYLVIYTVLVLVSAIFVLTGVRTAKDFIYLGAANTEYVRAEVIALNNEQLTTPDYGGDRLVGTQIVTMKLLDGEFEGRTVDVENFLLSDHYVYPEVGETVIASVEDRGDDVAPYCLLINHHRIPAIIFIVALFVALHVVTCGVKGLHALAGLSFTLITTLFFTIPMIYNGHSPILFAILTGTVCAGASLFLLNGPEKKTVSAFLATVVGFCMAGAAFAAFSAIGNVTGYNVPQMGTLTYFSAQTGLQVKHILFAGVLIASLGGIMDVSISVASAVSEVRRMNPSLNRESLFRSGLEVARDTSGTMSATLILVFTGGSLSTLIAMIAYGVKANQLFNSDTIAVEIGQGLSASVALLLTAPLASLFASVLFSKSSKVPQKDLGKQRRKTRTA
jgi:uncharacterized membrane protein